MKTDTIRSGYHLPHWRSPGAIYDLTIVTHQRRVLSAESRSVVRNYFEVWHSRRYTLHILVVMPDHVHVILTPLELDPSLIVNAMKIRTAKEINQIEQTSGQVWQRDFYNRIIRDVAELENRFSYVAHNPVRAGLCERIEDYPWVWVEKA